MPLSPGLVSKEVPAPQQPEDLTPHTTPETQNPNTSLLESSSLNGTELFEASTMFNSAVKASQDLPSSAKRFSGRMTRSFRTTHTENITLRTQLEEVQQLPNTRKARIKRKRFALEGRFVSSIEKVL